MKLSTPSDYGNNEEDTGCGMNDLEGNDSEEGQKADGGGGYVAEGASDTSDDIGKKLEDSSDDSGSDNDNSNMYTNWDNGELLTPTERAQIMKLSNYEKFCKMRICY